MPKQTGKILLRIGEELLSKVRARNDNISEGVRESLDRYFYLMDYERKAIQDKFTTGELSLLADICNGTWWQSFSILGGVLANAGDAEYLYYEKWSVNRKELLDKLQSLNAAQQFTLVDAIERFWAATKHSPVTYPGELLK